MLSGDLNSVQQSMLMEVMRYEGQREVDTLREQFKMMLLASHPSGSKIVREMRDGESQEEFARPLAEEEEGGPVDADSIETALADLAKMGFSIQNV